MIKETLVAVAVVVMSVLVAVMKVVAASQIRHLSCAGPRPLVNFLGYYLNWNSS